MELKEIIKQLIEEYGLEQVLGMIAICCEDSGDRKLAENIYHIADNL